jgi:Na+(H+)/acetate symporter ActP
MVSRSWRDISVDDAGSEDPGRGQENPVQLLGIVVYLLILVVIGVAASRRMHDARDFFAAGKRLGFLSVAFSARATGESAWLLLGLTGMGAAVGVHAFWVVLGEVLGVGCAWMFMSRRFKRLTDRYDSITIPDYLEARFRDQTHKLRLVAAFALLVFVTIYVSAQIDATGTAFETFFGWQHLGGFGVDRAGSEARDEEGQWNGAGWKKLFQCHYVKGQNFCVQGGLGRGSPKI